jgi:hypothetical protein
MCGAAIRSQSVDWHDVAYRAARGAPDFLEAQAVDGKVNER